MLKMIVLRHIFEMFFSGIFAEWNNRKTECMWNIIFLYIINSSFDQFK